jgi:glycosyltransferase involved in cell wall biosynthesis
MEAERQQPHFDVAIIIAVFNGASTIERTLDSIRGQTFQAAQVIVMDGGSSDGTPDILRKRSDVVTHWASGKDQGIYDAWNKGVDLVKAEWVMFLGADDFLWDQKVLERYASEVKRLPASVPYVYGRLNEVDEAGTVILESGAHWSDLGVDWPSLGQIPHPGMLHRFSALFDGRRFDIAFKVAGDYELLRLPLMQNQPVFLDFVVAGAQTGGVSTNPLTRWKSVHEWGLVLLKHDGRRTLKWHKKWMWEQVRRGFFVVFGAGALSSARSAHATLFKRPTARR